MQHVAANTRSKFIKIQPADGDADPATEACTPVLRRRTLDHGSHLYGAARPVVRGEALV